MVDAAMLRQQSQELAAAMARPEQAAHDVAGGPFNLGSPKQLQEVLYDQLQLPVLGKTPKGQPSTAEDVLRGARGKPRTAAARSWSTAASRSSRHLHGQAAGAGQSAHRAHAHLLPPSRGRDRPAVIVGSEPAEHPDSHRKKAGASARLSSRRRVQSARCRLLADRAADHGASVGRRGTAGGVRRRRGHSPRDGCGGVRHVPLALVSDEQRRSAKAINFGLIYGMSAFGLARQLGIERAQAQDTSICTSSAIPA